MKLLFILGSFCLFTVAADAQITDDEILNLISDEDSVWEALRGLSLVGTKDDLQLVQSYANSADASARIKEQATLTANAIQSR